MTVPPPVYLRMRETLRNSISSFDNELLNSLTAPTFTSSSLLPENPITILVLEILGE
eukprot:CAMPEP_0201097894 /NCGR_PEP_ID=MMETSP0812-20130820/6956_1 /ASSEMBLY_ACC=CAM_ASM_000668 /TAXON_ID=98059 /ORGANISM="Dinobryon sp., Strain UTEXLB2267" /LENGTH=56 /DNA_ID=CAMNT_0047353041 /DNA_START=713 /DNA_END=883 /DNA_ORIENTATION=-